MKIRLVGADLFHAYRKTDRHDETNSRFSQFCEKRLKMGINERHFNFGGWVGGENERHFVRIFPDFGLSSL